MVTIDSPCLAESFADFVGCSKLTLMFRLKSAMQFYFHVNLVPEAYFVANLLIVR